MSGITLATATTPHLFWITSRAAGTAALFLSSISVCVGLLISGRFVRGRGADLKPIHEALSIATIVAIVIHALSLLGDNFLKPTLADVTIPLHWSYKAGWTSLGIVAGWMLIALGPSYYLRRYIGHKRWVKLHRFTALVWIAGILHSIGEGTDASSPWFLILIGSTTIPALVLLALRHMTTTTPVKA